MRNQKDENGRYVGFWDKELLPIQAGDKVRVPKGTYIRTMHPSKANMPSQRSIIVTVDHLLSGAYWEEIDKKIIENPSVRWPGSGGYWMEADINDVIKV
jgi:hypothetical protein